MTQENKILLAKAIGESLYSGIICTDSVHGDSIIKDFEWDAATCEGLAYCFDFDEYVRINDVKLYLRPMSSMTEKEKKEIKALGAEFSSIGSIRFRIKEDENDGFEYGYKWIDIRDFLVTHHFDYRDLIPMGLALPARKGMYKKPRNK